MKYSNLEFDKIYILSHNNKEYFLYYLIFCIKNILDIYDIIKDFALFFENYEVFRFN